MIRFNVLPQRQSPFFNRTLYKRPKQANLIAVVRHLLVDILDAVPAKRLVCQLTLKVFNLFAQFV